MSERMSVSDLAERPATYRSLFADREFRALWIAQTISLTGDQLARVAIAFLVYDRTRSALVTALVYAVTYLPWLIGGPLLGGLADRYPRRTVMVACQLASAALVALMALPDLSTVLLAALLFVVILVESPFLSARAALLVDVLPDDRYVLASGVGQLTIQGTQVLGFALGGLLLQVLDPSQALLLDAATFLIAAALVRFAVRERDPAGDPAELGGNWRRLKDGARVVFGDPRLRGLVLLAWLATFWVVPEALAAPYVGADAPTALGLLLAAQPIGAVIGGLVLTRLVRPTTRLQLMGPLAALSSIPLLFFAVTPPVPVAVALLILSGIGTSYNVPANAAFMQAVPAERRGQAFGLVAAGLVAGQGVSIALAGALAESLGSSAVITIAGALGLTGALALSGAGRRFLMTPATVH